MPDLHWYESVIVDLHFLCPPSKENERCVSVPRAGGRTAALKGFYINRARWTVVQYSAQALCKSDRCSSADWGIFLQTSCFWKSWPRLANWWHFGFKEQMALVSDLGQLFCFSVRNIENASCVSCGSVEVNVQWCAQLCSGREKTGIPF